MAFCPIEQLNLIVDGDAEVASGQYVSGSYYRGIGVEAWRGRMLTELDDKPGAPPAAVITWRYWQRRFGGERSAIGKTVSINNVAFTIVGVSPPQFAGALEMMESADVSIPISTDPLVHADNQSVGKPGLYWLRVMARLQPGVSREQAQARMEPIFRRSVLDAWNVADHKDRAAITTLTERDYPHLMVNPGAQGDEFARRQFRQPLMLLMVVVGLVLLIACINVANLLLARSSARQQEFAASGAGREARRLIRQLLTECLLLSAIAGISGALLAVWGKDLLIGWAAWIRGGSTLQADVDLRVLGFTVAVSLLTGLLFGVAPAMRAGGTRLASGRQDTDRP
jgi:ABC-type antimicrobial peptide transport system, permease component